MIKFIMSRHFLLLLAAIAALTAVFHTYNSNYTEATFMLVLWSYLMLDYEVEGFKQRLDKVVQND